MPVLPTAHASQSYGRRQLEFFATTGHIASPDRRQRASERRFQDMDGGMHTVRLANADAPMETGDSIAVLRAQSGPDRQSRPVSVINYRTNSWEAAAPDATRALSRAGITRGANWWLSMIAVALFAIVLVWPALRSAFIEINPSLFAGLPAFDLVALVAAQAGFLIGADPAASIGGLDRVVAATGIFGPEAANAVLLGAGLALLGLIAYVGRTWRVVWVPLFIAAALSAGLVLGGVEGASGITLMAIGGLVLFFSLAGFINRVRDASRFRGRVARLSEHMLRNPPQESVVSPPPAQRSEAGLAAATLSAGAVALAELEPAEASAGSDAAPDDAGPARDEAERTHADPAEDVAEGLGAESPDAAAGPETPEAAATADAEDAPRTLSAAATAEDSTLTRDARTSAAFGALAAAMAGEETQTVAADDDLPTDADLARARGEAHPDDAVVSLRAPESEAPETTDRDMTLPEPPPLAAQPEPADAAVIAPPANAADLPDEADTPELASDDDHDPMMSRDEPSGADSERQT